MSKVENQITQQGSVAADFTKDKGNGKTTIEKDDQEEKGGNKTQSNTERKWIRNKEGGLGCDGMYIDKEEKAMIQGNNGNHR